MQNNMPEWLTQNDTYSPPKDSDGFIDSATRRIIATLSRLRKSTALPKAKRINTALRLFGILLAIIFTSASANFYFVFIMLTATAVCLALSPPQVIKEIIKVLLPVTALTVIILLPALFMGNTHSMLSVTCRIIVSVTLVMRFNLTYPWNSITSALKKLHIPDIIIFIFDITIHYISILGEICSEMISALKIRSIGKNNDKSKALSGILGTVFIKSKEGVEQTGRAMECRGFNGEFVISDRNKFTKYDIPYIILLAIMTGVFIYFQVVMK